MLYSSWMPHRQSSRRSSTIRMLVGVSLRVEVMSQQLVDGESRSVVVRTVWMCTHPHDVKECPEPILPL
jgi:hypothetical protein